MAIVSFMRFAQEIRTFAEEKESFVLFLTRKFKIPVHEANNRKVDDTKCMMCI